MAHYALRAKRGAFDGGVERRSVGQPLSHSVTSPRRGVTCDPLLLGEGGICKLTRQSLSPASFTLFYYTVMSISSLPFSVVSVMETVRYAVLPSNVPALIYSVPLSSLSITRIVSETFTEVNPPLV